MHTCDRGYKCKVCGATIDPLVYTIEDYAYKLKIQRNGKKVKTYYFCCWGHLRQYEKEINYRKKILR